MKNNHKIKTTFPPQYCFFPGSASPLTILPSLSQRVFCPFLNMLSPRNLCLGCRAQPWPPVGHLELQVPFVYGTGQPWQPSQSTPRISVNCLAWYISINVEYSSWTSNIDNLFGNILSCVHCSVNEGITQSF